MIETIEFNRKVYPKLQSEGFASRWALPFAEKLCKGIGYDIGCNREEWKMNGAIAVDPVIDDRFDAYNLPTVITGGNITEVSMLESGEYGIGMTYDKELDTQVDYIFSSHCLEHLPDWVKALDYWSTKLRRGGQLFLYLPNMDEQHYWRPWHNRKHLHYINPDIIEKYLLARPEMWYEVMVTKGYDLNASFYAIANKI